MFAIKQRDKLFSQAEITSSSSGACRPPSCEAGEKGCDDIIQRQVATVSSLAEQLHAQGKLAYPENLNNLAQLLAAPSPTPKSKKRKKCSYPDNLKKMPIFLGKMIYLLEHDPHFLLQHPALHQATPGNIAQLIDEVEKRYKLSLSAIKQQVMDLMQRYEQSAIVAPEEAIITALAKAFADLLLAADGSLNMAVVEEVRECLIH